MGVSKIGQNIRRFRREQDMTQAGLAKRARVARATIAHIETGITDYLNQPQIERIARALRRTAADLIEGDPSAETVDLATVIPAYLDKWGKVDEPTEDELALLNALGDSTWRVIRPTPDALHDMVSAMRRK